jgi:DNA polymerase-3 subunit alpha
VNKRSAGRPDQVRRNGRVSAKTRATLLSAVDACADAGQRAAREALTGQFGLFDDAGSTQASFADLCPKRLSEFPKRQLLEMEREMLGVYLSDSPLSEVRDTMKQHATHRIAMLTGMESGVQLSIAGLVSSSRKIITRFKTPMVFLQFEDETGTTEVTIRPATYDKCAALLQDGALLLVRGRTEIRQARRDADDDGADAPQEQVKVTAEEILCLQSLAAAKNGKAKLRLPGVHIRVQMFQSDFMPQLRDILLRHRGDQEVYLHLVSPQGETVMHLAETFNVRDTNELKTGGAQAAGAGSDLGRGQLRSLVHVGSLNHGLVDPG